MKWQDISKILAGMSTVGVVGLFAYLFLLTGMDYSHSGDSNCFYKDGIYRCNAFINITTRYWNFEFEHLSPDSYIYLPADLEDFTGKLTRYKVGDLDLEPVLYKKSTRGRKLWVNLDRIDNIIDTQPSIKVDWLVPARGKDNWRHVKEGDTWDRLKNNRIKLIGYPESEFDNIIWEFKIGEVDIDPVWYGSARYETTHKKINGKNAVEIRFNNLHREYNINTEAKKQNKNPKELLNVKKTKYYGDVDIKIMHYVNVTTQTSYECNCIKHITYRPNGTKQTSRVCDTCHKDITNEVFQEINPDTFILKNNEPIYEIMEKSTKFEKVEGGWGYAVWTDVTIMGLEIEGATWWNSTFLKKKEIQINNTDLEVANYSLLLNITYDSDMSAGFEDIRFSNGSEDTSLSYWIENKVSSSYADVWVKIPYTLTNITNTTIYMYYDNSSFVSSESDIEYAFSLGDNFNLDYTGWDCTGTCTIESNALKLDTNAAFAIKNSIYPEAFIVELRAKYTSGGVWSYILKDGDDERMYGYLMHSNNNVYLYRSSTVIISNSWSGDTNYHTMKYRRNNVGGWEMWLDDVSKGTASDTTYPYTDFKRYKLWAPGGEDVYVDWIIIRGYLSTTPTYSFGAEEVSGLSIDIVSPTNTTYDTTSIDLNWTNSTETDWVGYSLNGASNVTLTGNITITAIEGSNHVIVYGNDTSGVMTSDEEWFTVKLHIVITIESPTNTTYTVDYVDLNWTVDKIVDWARYSLDDAANITVFNYTTVDTETSYSCEGVFHANGQCSKAVDENWATWAYPNSSLSSVCVYENITMEGNIHLINWTYKISVSGGNLNLSYLDTSSNWNNLAHYTSIGISTITTTIPENGLSNNFRTKVRMGESWLLSYYESSFKYGVIENITLTGLSEGSHNIIVWANTTAGVMNSSYLVYFTVDTEPPLIEVDSPTNISYGTASIWFNITSYDVTNVTEWCGYSLDGSSNISLSNSSGNWNDNNASVTEGSHYVNFYCNDSNGNMNSTEALHFTIDLTPPTITINKPLNDTVNDDTFNVTFGETVNWSAYSLNGAANVSMGAISTYETTLAGLSDGSNYIIVYANDSVGNMNDSTRHWTRDTDGPGIEIQSPENKTYVSSSVWFNVTLDESGSWCGYSLDSATNITMTNSSGNWNNQNTTMSEGYHAVVFYCNDTTGNMNNTAELGFTVNTTVTIELYLNGTSASRYYELGTYTNLTAMLLDANGDVSVSNIWLDIDILGYGDNYTTSATGIVNYDFLTHTVKDVIITFENTSCNNWNEVNTVTVYGECSWSIGMTDTLEYPQLYKNSTLDTLLFDITYCYPGREGRLLLYSGGVLKYNETCSVQNNVEVSLGTAGIDRTINFTTENYTAPNIRDLVLGNIRLLNYGEVTSHTFTGSGRITGLFGWDLNTYDDIDSVEFDLTGNSSDNPVFDNYADSYSCNGTFKNDKPCINGVDNNWLTWTQLVNDTTGSFGDIKETWDVPFNVISANFTSKYWLRNNCQGSTKPHTCLNSTGEWENISISPNPHAISTNTGIIPADCYSGTELLIKTCLDGHDEVLIPYGRYFDGRVEWVMGYPANVSIDLNQDGLDKQYPLAYLIGENEFYTDKVSTNEIKTNLTFDTAESNTFYISFPTDGFDYERGTFNLTGYPFLVTQQSSLYDNYTSNFSIKNIDSNLWIYDINTTGIIPSGTLLKFPHCITEEGGNVHPVKIYNITDTADEDSTILVIGEKWGGNSSLRQSPYNSSEIEWTPHLTLPDNSIFRIVIGKNVTWENETTAKEIAINFTTTLPHLYMNVESTHLQSNTTQATDSCSTTTNCIYTCYGTPCLYDGCYFGGWSNYCAGTNYGYARDCNDNMGDCNGGEVTAFLNYILYDYNTISNIAFNYSYYTYGYSLDVDFYYYNKYVLGYEHIFNKHFGGWYQPTQTTTSSYTDAAEYISATGEFKVKQIMIDQGSGHNSNFWKPYLIYNRSVYNPEVKLFSTIIWYYNGLMDSSNDTSTSDDLSGYINSYEETDFLFNFTSDGRYGELLIYFEPFWTSTPENITVQVGDSTDYIYQNTTIFNTTEEINISMADEIKDYISANCEDETICNVSFRISSAKAGVLEVSNINFSYSYDTIALDSTDVTSGTPVIDLVFYDGSITIDDLNVTYYGSKNITVVAHNADYSINDTHDIKVVFSNFSMAYPYTFMDFLYWAPYTNNIQNVEPVSQSSTRPGITFTSLAYDQKFDIYMKTDNQLYCINTSIYTARTVADEIEITNTSYTKVVNDINIRTDTPDYNETWLWRDYNNCDGVLYRYYEPNISIYGKCTECV